MKLAITVLICLLLAGCVSDGPAPTVDLSPLSAQIGNLSNANADLRAANETLRAANARLQAENDHLKAVLRADTDAGSAANANGSLRFEGFVWQHQATLLPVTPDPATAQDWTRAWSFFTSGNESALLGVIGKLQSDAGTLNTELGKAQEAVKTAQDEVTRLQAVADAALKKAQEAKDALDAAVAKATADERARLEAETRAWQARSANWLGGILGVAALGCVAGMIFLPEAAKLFRKAGIVAGVGSVALLALARFLSSPWFDVAWKAALAAGAVGGLSWGLWELRSAIKRALEAKKAGEAAMVADTVISVLDDYNDNRASAEAKADMADKLWPALQEKGPAYDAAVKRIKAAQCDKIAAK